MKEIYLGGGCFWGMEKLMRALPGVMDVVCGYANGVSEQEAEEYAAPSAAAKGRR